MDGNRDKILSAVRRRALLWSNLLLCLILLLALALLSYFGYRIHDRVNTKGAEELSALIADGVSQQMTATIIQPTTVALTIANDHLLMRLLEQGTSEGMDSAHDAALQEYLDGYRLKYGFDTISLISANSNSHYHFSDKSAKVETAAPERDWYSALLAGSAEYETVIHHNPDLDNPLTAQITCKMRSDSGLPLGAVAVSAKLPSPQALLEDYAEQYHVQLWLVDDSGAVQFASTPAGEAGSPFDGGPLSEYQNSFLSTSGEQQTLWYGKDGRDGYAVSQYIPTFQWHLVVNHSRDGANQVLTDHLTLNAIVLLCTLVVVLCLVSFILYQYGRRLLTLTVSQELEYQRLLHSVTEGLYENVFEWDITHDSVNSDATRQYLRDLGSEGHLTYDEAIRLLAERQMKPEHIPAYLELYCRERVLEAFQNGINNLSYDFLKQTPDGYQWIRLNARLFFWGSDHSVRMLTYRQNIDAEKQHELELIQQARLDSLSNLLNKRSTEEAITAILHEDNRRGQHALLLLDIDNFKVSNDRYGHSFGDQIIQALGSALKSHFRESDVVGRIGGDEFAVLLCNYTSAPAVRERMQRLCALVGELRIAEHPEYRISISIGAALSVLHGSAYDALYDKADQALYFSKRHGKNTFTIYAEKSEDKISYMVNQRDMEALINTATDGICKVACIDNAFKLLYFNAACAALTGSNSADLADPALDILEQVHPDDSANVLAVIQSAIPNRDPFSIDFRLLHHDGHWLSVRLRGLFVTEQYENQYPVFYATYTDLTAHPALPPLQS